MEGEHPLFSLLSSLPILFFSSILFFFSCVGASARVHSWLSLSPTQVRGGGKEQKAKKKRKKTKLNVAKEKGSGMGDGGEGAHTGTGTEGAGRQG